MKTTFTKIFAACAFVFVYASLGIVIINCIREAIAYKNDPVIAEINRREKGPSGGDRVPPVFEEDRNPDGIGNCSIDYDKESDAE